MFSTSLCFFISGGITVIINIAILYVYYALFIFFFPFTNNNNDPNDKATISHIVWFVNYGVLTWTIFLSFFSFLFAWFFLKRRIK
jgi:hypothetical protein